MSRPSLLVVEDDPEIRDQMRWAMEDTYAVHLAGTPREALALMKRDRPALVTLDLGLPPHPDDAAEGLAVLEGLLGVDRSAKVIVITGNSEKAHALDAIQRGAYDFIQKPVQIDALKIILQRASYLYQLEQENVKLQQQKTHEGFQDIIGMSAPMHQLFATIRRVAASDLAVLIMGESGTGKELVARAIHRESARRGGPFIAINCGAIPDTLLESELFGHEKGAFTGAHVQRKGRIESAQGGTLLLDEIGELPLALQVKLLRFLQEQRIERVGGREPIPVDTRVVAATNVNLGEALDQGLFRKDLFYRLGVVQITVPPLRERDDDLLYLAQAFVQRCRDELNVRVTGLSAEAQDAIQAYAWPGNVRELENRIKRAVVMAEGRILQPADLELSGGPMPPPAVTLKEARTQMEKSLIRQALIRTNGNVTRAAEELGISRQTLHESMNKYGLISKNTT
ncbi:MAG TPA: PEP-CTERM-box response regulator transcription factor [Nitrospiraceae bacterium]|nr:PEP-CTERM-box response regulator transcription factor [Nitrospiraceae bacterium]